MLYIIMIIGKQIIKDIINDKNTQILVDDIIFLILIFIKFFLKKLSPIYFIKYFNSFVVIFSY